MFRIVFIPLFLYCNIRPNDRNITEVVFESDTAYIAIMMLFDKVKEIFDKILDV